MLSILAKLVLLGLSLIVAALLAEAMVRIAKPGFPGFRLPQVDHRPVAGLGFEMVPNQSAYSTASRVTINSAGFRGPEIRSLVDAGRPRILCLGDSMTLGVAVEDHEVYPRQLEQMLARTSPLGHPEVINAGVQRYFTFQEIDLLKRHAATLRPDVVTLAVYINDIALRRTEDYVREYENEREQAATAFRRRLPTAYLVIKNSAMVELAKNAYLPLIGSRRGGPNTEENALAGRTSHRDEAKWRSVENEFVTFVELARLHQFKPIVVFVPVRQQVEEDVPGSLYPRRLVEHARRIGLAAVDPTAVFKQAFRDGSDPYLPWDNHMSVTGHRLMAEALMREVSREISTGVERPSSELSGR